MVACKFCGGSHTLPESAERCEIEQLRTELQDVADELDENPTVYDLIGIRHRILELLRITSTQEKR